MPEATGANCRCWQGGSAADMLGQEGENDSAAWFLFSEADEPLGPVFRGPDEAVPVVGERLTDGDRWVVAEVVSFEELRASCAVRRFRVVVRVVG